MKKVISEIKDFFDSYDVLQHLMDHNNIMVHIREINGTTCKVRVVERIDRLLDANMFCEVSISGNMMQIRMRLREDIRDKNAVLKKLENKNYTVDLIGRMVHVKMYSVSVENVRIVFTLLEPLCRSTK